MHIGSNSVGQKKEKILLPAFSPFCFFIPLFQKLKFLAANTMGIF
jgi:hypothetical protein